MQHFIERDQQLHKYEIVFTHTNISSEIINLFLSFRWGASTFYKEKLKNHRDKPLRGDFLNYSAVIIQIHELSHGPLFDVRRWVRWSCGRSALRKSWRQWRSRFRRQS